ncbi:MAG: glycosyltransferase family 9 protein [Verrucomicrobia bacterium]|nr:glycosyltransferase family 9 protein [Verrucomicrobiota bacterium]
MSFGFFAHAGNLDKRLQDYFGGFAIIISYLYDPDEIFKTNVARCSKAQFIAGPHRPDDAAGVHATKVLLKPLERLAIFEASHVPRLQITTAERGPTAAGGGGHPLLVLHPGSGSERKNWPEAAWAELLRELAAVPDLAFRLVGGEVEGTRLDRLAALLPRPRTELWRSLPLVELAGRLAACDAFMGHDSGISHLAAALGLPTLVLWGETVETVWRPQGHHVRILSAGPSLPTLPVQTVLANLCPVKRRLRAGA